MKNENHYKNIDGEKSNFKVQFAIDQGKLVTINEAQKGDNAEYICLCGGLLHIREGDIRKKHFAHNKDAGNCDLESNMHKGYIRAIIEQGKIMLPGGIIANFLESDAIDTFETDERKDYILKKYGYDIKKYGKVPDILAKTDMGNIMWIEVKVTHGKDKSNIKEISRIAKELKTITVIEISTLFDIKSKNIHFELSNYDMDKINDHIINQTIKKEILFDTERNKMLRESFKEQLQKIKNELQLEFDDTLKSEKRKLNKDFVNYKNNYLQKEVAKKIDLKLPIEIERKLEQLARDDKKIYKLAMKIFKPELAKKEQELLEKYKKLEQSIIRSHQNQINIINAELQSCHKQIKSLEEEISSKYNGAALQRINNGERVVLSHIKENIYKFNEKQYCVSKYEFKGQQRIDIYKNEND